MIIQHFENRRELSAFLSGNPFPQLREKHPGEGEIEIRIAGQYHARMPLDLDLRLQYYYAA